MADTNRPRDTENLARTQGRSDVSAANATRRQINPTLEDEYWRANFASRPYVRADRGYEYYRPAYQLGWEARGQQPANAQWHDVEPDLRRSWDARHSAAAKTEHAGEKTKNVIVGMWDDIKDAVKEGWEHAVHP